VGLGVSHDEGVGLSMSHDEGVGLSMSHNNWECHMTEVRLAMPHDH